MSDTQVAAAPDPVVSLPCPLPDPYTGEPKELTEYRKELGSDRLFLKLRRQFRDNEDWRALATLLVLHAAHIDKPSKAIEFAVQAYEIWLERAKDRGQAAYALARAVMLQPDNEKAFERLRKLYDSLGWHKHLITLLRWRIELTSAIAPESVPSMRLELARLLETQIMDVGGAVAEYETAIIDDPDQREASEHLIRLYLEACAWRQASDVIHRELATLDAAADPDRVAELHVRMARIEAQHLDNVASAARHLQAALKAKPEHVDALREFGIIYLGSGKASDEGLAKAADIFYKAAQLARRNGDHPTALKLLRRSLGLRPDHQEASAALEQTLIAAEDWLAVDDLYREWLTFFTGADAVPLLMRRAELLENRLARREEARRLYEEASRYQAPDGPAWKRLREIYEETKDYHALAALLEAYAERLPDQVPTATLLRIAELQRDELGADERAAVFYYRVLEREPFNVVAFEGYKEHWRRKHNWAHLRDLILYQIDQAMAYEGPDNPSHAPSFVDEFIELAEICERRLGDIDGALDAWNRMASVYSRDERPAQNIARIEKRARMWDNMVRVQEAELERTADPTKRLDILKRLTQVYRDRQVNPERAIELYREILELSPNDLQATRALTALYDRAGDYAQVTEMLHEQYEKSRSNTERISLLRRMAELWHHELQEAERAVWACEQILSHAPADREAMHRLQLIYEEQGQHESLLEVLEQELRVLATPEDKIKVLRRMARVAERDLGDHERAAEIWNQLLGLQPSSIEVVDKMIDVYERTGRVEDMSTLLGKAAASAKTPPIRQQDYLLRLGHLAESTLEDPDLARSAFERVLRLRNDHRGALEALVRLYREDKAWQALGQVLGTLQGMAETDDDEFRLTWERAEILSDRLDDPEGGAKVLEELPERIRAVHPEVGETLLDFYARGGQWRKVVRQAEMMLLASDVPQVRRRLFETVSDAWLRHLDDKHAALAAHRRFIDEFSDDLDGLWTLANLQEEVGDHDGTLATLTRRLELAADPNVQVTTLEHMAQVCEKGLKDPAGALDLLHRALVLDPHNEGIKQRVEAVAAGHGLWRELLAIYDGRFDQMGDRAEFRAQIETCLEAADVAERRLSDPELSFNWARRGYFVAFQADLDADESYARLQQLAEDHDLWQPMLEVTEQEIAMTESVADGRHGDFDTIQRLLSAADIAEQQLADAKRAVGYLQRAHRLRPDDEDLSRQLESTAEKHQLWQPIIELHEDRLTRAETAIGRFDAHATIAKLHEQRLDDPEGAFARLRRAWTDLAVEESLAQDIIDAMLGLAERHGLWLEFAHHQLELGRERLDAGDIDGGMAALAEAARIHDGRLEDPMAAIRALTQGLEHDPEGDRLLPEIRALSQRIDDGRKSSAEPALGALALLAILQRLVARSRDDDVQRNLVRERAQIREERLADPVGAMAEWLRLFRLEPDGEEPRAELERLASSHALWGKYLVVPGWCLDRARTTERQAELLLELAQVYEERLERPEYAFRARIEAWRRHPELPPREGELDEEHATLWRLAGRTGAYQTPPVPKDPLLEPVIDPPELEDVNAWRSAGVDPASVFEPPSVHRSKVKRATEHATAAAAATGAIATPMPDGGSTQVIAIDDLELMQDGDGSSSPAASDDTPMEELEEIEDLLEVDADSELLEEIEPEPSAPIAIRREAAPPRPPPPPPADPDAGLPALPVLSGALLPSRPRVATAWEELTLAYSEVATASKHEKAEVAMVLARAWEEGAGQVERAFQQYEQALLFVPELPQALEGLQGLAERHDAVERLLLAYERLLGDAALPEHVVAQSLRIARLHEERDNVASAEERYRGVLAVQPNHVEALQALADIYESSERWADYIEMYSELLDVQNPELDDDERISRTRRLAELSENKLQRTEDAVELLERLVREYPHERDVHEQLISVLTAHGFWQKAIDSLRTAADAVAEDDFRCECLARIGEIYENRLKIPDRAIDAWSQIAEARTHDDHALANLQRLYLATGRFEPLLPIIDRRLELVDVDDREVRISLLVAKARALQEGLGDEAGAAETLEQLVEEAPENDDVVTGLSRLYRKTGRFDDGIELLRARLDGLGPAEHGRRAKLAEALARALYDESKDAEGALEIIRRALEASPDAENLRRIRAELARILHDLPLLVDSLTAMADPDGWLEAAYIASSQIRDSARAVRLYSRVLAESKDAGDDVDHQRRLAAAIEGLVKLRIDDGDVQGAMDFMDRQLAEVEGPQLRARLLTQLGRITYRTTRDVEAATAKFDAALAEDPDYAPAKLGLGELMMEAERMTEAEKLLEPAVDALGLIRDQEHLVEGLVLMARLLERTNRSGEAYRRLTTALRHDPDDFEIRAAIVHNRLGAQRWRDVVTAVEQMDSRLREGLDVPHKHARRVSNMFVAAAEGETNLKHPEQATSYYRRALEIDSGNPRAIEALVPICHEEGALEEAAKLTETLARQTDDSIERGRRYIEAGIIYHEAAAALADAGERTSAHGATEEELRKGAFESVRMGLALIESSDKPVLDRPQLEAALRATADHHRGIALRVLDRLLMREDIAADRRHDLLLEGVRLSLADQTIERAEEYAHKARKLAPTSSAAVLAIARVFEAQGRIDEIEPIVELYFARLPEGDESSDERHTRVKLLVRLAELQAAYPEKAVASLERAASIDPGGLSLDERRKMAEFYHQAGTTGERVFDNHLALLALDPLYAPSIAAVAARFAEAGDTDRAYALYQVLQIIDPLDETAQAFLESHEEVAGPTAGFDLEALSVALPSDGGIAEALLQLWDGAASLLAEYLPRVEVPQDARISPVGDSTLARSWGEVLKKLGQSKVALIDGSVLDDHGEEVAEVSDRWFEIRCQHPPVIVARPEARNGAEPPQLRFALGRALFFTRPEAVFATGLPRATLARIISATLQAFHPRHARRKHHSRESDQVARLSQELARKLPIRVARQLSSAFKDHESETFDSRNWRSSIRRAGNRAGLVVAGDVDAALRVVANDAVVSDPDTLRKRVESDEELRDLIAFATSEAFVEARRKLGYHVKAR